MTAPAAGAGHTVGARQLGGPANIDRTIAAAPVHGADDTLAHRTFRTARKAHRCGNAYVAERGHNEIVAKTCRRTIAKGERYLEGDMDPYYAGGFGHDRFCMACAEAGLA